MESQRELFAAAVDIRQWLAADSRTPAAERLRRDRAIGQSFGEAPAEFYRRVLAWWARLEAPDEGQGKRIAGWVSVANGLLGIIGALAGLSIAGAAFTYQGDHPVNLFALLGILVGLPLLFLLAQIVFLAGIPVPRGIRDAVAVLSPARWAGTILERRLPAGLFESVGGTSLSGAFGRWQLIVFSQVFAIGYFIGVIGLALLLVTFTDLAFGWSSTLDIEPAEVLNAFQLVALPWSAIVPSAVPDAALVEASRYFRLEGASAAVDASRLGQWWPFVLLTICVYGLAPRLLVAVVASRRLRRATIRLIEEGPEIASLLDRLTSPSVGFETDGDDTVPDNPAEAPSIPGLEIDSKTPVVVWNDAISQEAFVRMSHGKEQPPRVDAAEWGDISQSVSSLARIRPQPAKVVIVAKGWEPPLLSFRDLVAAVRAAIGVEAIIVVVPLGEGGEIDPADRQIWSQALARHADPLLYVAGDRQ